MKVSFLLSLHPPVSCYKIVVITRFLSRCFVKGSFCSLPTLQFLAIKMLLFLQLSNKKLDKSKTTNKIAAEFLMFFMGKYYQNWHNSWRCNQHIFLPSTLLDVFKFLTNWFQWFIASATSYSSGFYSYKIANNISAFLN